MRLGPQDTTGRPLTTNVVQMNAQEHVHFEPYNKCRITENAFRWPPVPPQEREIFQLPQQQLPRRGSPWGLQHSLAELWQVAAAGMADKTEAGCSMEIPRLNGISLPYKVHVRNTSACAAGGGAAGGCNSSGAAGSDMLIGMRQACAVRPEDCGVPDLIWVDTHRMSALASPSNGLTAVICSCCLAGSKPIRCTGSCIGGQIACQAVHTKQRKH